ncbi:hypothetical protein GCM10011371_18440 [Novosphingobium marinum]|nr:hypothetical protein GCM10011371_18440 [Novosphingobium marinum]
MARLNSAKKKMGRPPVDSEAVNVRMQRDQITRLDQWAAEQPDNPTRPEAIRRLVSKALEGESE